MLFKNTKQCQNFENDLSKAESVSPINENDITFNETKTRNNGLLSKFLTCNITNDRDSLQFVAGFIIATFLIVSIILLTVGYYIAGSVLIGTILLAACYCLCLNNHQRSHLTMGQHSFLRSLLNCFHHNFTLTMASPFSLHHHSHLEDESSISLHDQHSKTNNNSPFWKSIFRPMPVATCDASSNYTNVDNVSRHTYTTSHTPGSENGRNVLLEAALCDSIVNDAENDNDDKDICNHDCACQENKSPTSEQVCHSLAIQRDFSDENGSCNVADILDPSILDQENNDDDGSSVSPGLSSDDIERLPVSIINKDHNLEKLPACGICLENFEIDDFIRTMSCMHTFHPKCIDPWLKKKPICPTCKFEVLVE